MGLRSGDGDDVDDSRVSANGSKATDNEARVKTKYEREGGEGGCTGDCVIKIRMMSKDRKRQRTTNALVNKKNNEINKEKNNNNNNTINDKIDPAVHCNNGKATK